MGNQQALKDSIIRCNGVWKIFHESRPHEVRALVDVTLSVARGSFTVFSGPSGSGKTTLVSILGTIQRPTRGTVFFDGSDVTKFSEAALTRLRRERVGYVFQNFQLIQGLRAWENVAIPLVPLPLTERERRERAFRLLDRLGLGERSGHIPEELSGGEQQRVAIARALVNDPDVVVLDEPTSNIDADNITTLTAILHELRAAGRTVMATSHDEALLRTADSIHELRKGQVFMSAGPAVAEP